MNKNIVIICPESKFTTEQLYKLNSAGNTIIVDSKKSSLAKYIKEADVIAISPEKGDKNTRSWLAELLKKSPQVKGLAINSSGGSFIDKDYCLEKGIVVSVIPEHATEAVAEYVMLLLLGAARRIFVDDWHAQKRKYSQEPGFELSRKTLGIIGVDRVSEGVIDFAKYFDMRIYVYSQKFVTIRAERRSLSDVLLYSDLITIHLPQTEENKRFLSKERINCIRQGAVLINISGQSLVDEKALAEALKSGRISQYIYETETVKSSPLQNIDNALAFKPLSKNTWESKARSKAIWVDNIVNLAKGTPNNRLF